MWRSTSIPGQKFATWSAVVSGGFPKDFLRKLEIARPPGIPMVFHGLPWSPVVSHGLSWASIVVSHDLPWSPMISRGSRLVRVADVPMV